MTPNEIAWAARKRFFDARRNDPYQLGAAAELKADVEAAIAEAAAAAVERCAQLAAAYNSHPGDPSWVHCETGAAEGATAEAIAARIRSGL